MNQMYFFRWSWIIVLCVASMSSCRGEEDPIGPTPWPDMEGGGEKGVIEKYQIGDRIISSDSLKLSWSDEFDEDGMVNEEYWTYEKGFVRNQEIQYYTEARPENCRVENGHLIITGRKEDRSFGNTEYSDGTITSASIITNKKLSWKYGRFEVRAKVPAGKGPWPAFWAKGDSQNTGDRWPACGEIDIMEYSAKGPAMYQNIIFGEDANSVQQEVKITEKDFSDDFHIYSMDWNENRIVFAIDHIVTNTIDLNEIHPNPFRQKFSILLNLALGASTDRTLGGKLDPEVLPVEFIVDYVRVYEF